ncbi:MAG: hypothetical protein FJ014_18115 [Chloroflexi bacterium]|nr:hypothetical protein [Chloroflexota bacterium]
MSEQLERYRIYSHITRSRWLHIEDALDIGKVRLFAGDYQKGQGAKAVAWHYLDVADARVLFSDLAWGKPVDFCEFKGTANGGQAISRVLKVKTKDDKTWFALENGPGEVIGEGAVKPAGEPEAMVNVPFNVWDARRLAFTVLAHLDAWTVITFKSRVLAQNS